MAPHTNRRREIELAIERADKSFMECWEFLAAMKDGKLRNDKSMSLFQFQPELATTLRNLTRLYRKIEQEKRDRIQRKATFSARWFAARMRFLSNQQEILNRAMAIGKGIGDAFAWFFYRHDRHYLAEHLAQPSQLHTPPGIGGIGELEFVKQIQRVEGYFLLYHGNTNMLRLGDFTLIDTNGLRVAGIGELKSQSLTPDKLELSLIISGPKIRKDFFERHPLTSSKSGGREKVARSLSPRGEARLKRQMQKISKSYKNLGSVPDDHVSIGIDSYYDTITEFISGLKPGQFAYKQLGKGLLLIGYREVTKHLYKKLSSHRKTNLKPKLDQAPQYAAGLMANNREDNAIVIGSFYYDVDGNTHHMSGMSHLVWWPLSKETIRGVLFQDIMLFTLMNPVHLIVALEAAGFSVKETGPLQYEISKEHRGHKLVVEGMNHYLRMIQEWFVPEEFIVSCVNEAEKKISSMDGKGNGRIELHIEQRFGRMPLKM